MAEELHLEVNNYERHENNQSNYDVSKDVTFLQGVRRFYWVVVLAVIVESVVFAALYLTRG